MIMEARLDAAESVFFKRQLEAIDAQVYETKYPEFMARGLLPTQGGVPEGAKSYTYRMMDEVGSAKILHNLADDLPRVDVLGQEVNTLIKLLGDSYGYDIMEIKAAAMTGTPLDSMKAAAARRAVEREIDRLLSLGDTAYGIKGLLSLTNTTTYTVSTKAASGDTEWGTLAAPIATGAEVAADLMGFASDLVEKTLGVFTRFSLLLPIEQFNYAAQTRIGSNSDTTALKFALATSPYIESIQPWYRCNGAGSGPSDRMVAYPRDPNVLSALVPMEFSVRPPQEKNLEFVINAIASCGGVVCRYPVAVSYADNI